MEAISSKDTKPLKLGEYRFECQLDSRVLSREEKLLLYREDLNRICQLSETFNHVLLSKRSKYQEKGEKKSNYSICHDTLIELWGLASCLT